MKRAWLFTLVAAIVVSSLLIATSTRSRADETLEERVAALETRVAVLEGGTQGTPAQSAGPIDVSGLAIAPTPTSEAVAPSPTATASGDDEAVVIESGPRLPLEDFGPYTIEPGTYDVLFFCLAPFPGPGWVRSEQGDINVLLYSDGEFATQELRIDTRLDDVEIGTGCNGSWSLSIYPAS